MYFPVSYGGRGKIIVGGLFTISPRRVSVEDFVLDNRMLKLLFEEGDPWAWRLVREVVEAPIDGYFKGKLLSTASKGDPEGALRLLREWLANKPGREPRFYKGFEEYGEPTTVYLLSEEGCAGFFCGRDLAGVAERFPPNVYFIKPVIHLLPELTLERFNAVQSDLAGFFRFSVRLLRVKEGAEALPSGYRVRFAKLADRCFEEYFADRGFAERWLASIERLFEEAARGSAIYDELRSGRVVECAGGWLIMHDLYTYYVAENGEVYRLESPSIFDIYKVYVGRFDAVKRRAAAENDSRILRRIAEVIGRIKPALLPVMLP